ncbi:MAG: AAA family ATPase [Azonexus sp.]
MRARTLPKMEWIIPSLLPAGATLFAGPEKVGKSFISLDLAFAVACGGRAMGALPVPEGRSLYIALEDHVTRIVERLKMLEPDESLWPLENMSLTTAREAPGGALSPVMDRWYEDGANPRLVIIDTLGVYKSNMAGSEMARARQRMSPYDADVSLVRPLTNWAQERNIAVLLVTHTNQAKLEPGESWTKQVQGTTAIVGSVDQSMVLFGERGTRDATLKLVGRDMPDADYSLYRTGPWWHVTDAPRDSRLGDRTNDVIEFVLTSEAPVSPKIVAEALGLDNKYVGTLLGEQVGRRVGRAGRGLYWKLDG